MKIEADRHSRPEDRGGRHIGGTLMELEVGSENHMEAQNGR